LSSRCVHSAGPSCPRSSRRSCECTQKNYKNFWYR
jgi:hypothetical protein